MLSEYEKAWRSWSTGAPVEKRPRLFHILHAVVLTTGVPAGDIKSNRRTQDLARARQIFFYIARHMTPLSYPQIGMFMDRDHTTVMHGVRRIERFLSEGHPEIAADVAAVKALVVRIANEWEGAI